MTGRCKPASIRVKNHLDSYFHNSARVREAERGLPMGPTLKMKRRLNLGIAGVLALFTVYIITNLVRISIVDSADYQDKANRQQLNSLEIPANRGTIYDTNGKVLARSATVWRVILEPTKLRQVENEKTDLIIQNLVAILGVDEEHLRAQTQKNNQYEIVKRQIEQDGMEAVLAFVEANNIKSIYFTEDTKRYYPNGSLAANVLGFTGYDNNGMYGLEAYYEDYLSGSPGRVIRAQDAKGGDVPYRYRTVYEPEDGGNLVLTIDEVLQHYVEKYLKPAVEENLAEQRATAIIMNPKTGAVLAMATYPSYDPNSPNTLNTLFQQQYDTYVAEGTHTEEEVKNRFIELRETQWKNKAVGETYYPGSVFKVVTASSAIEEKLVSLNETFSTTDSITIGGHKFKNWRTSGNGVLTFTQAMVNSNNPVFVQIGLRLGSTLFFQYYRAFGFTERTGIDLPGEVNSIHLTEDKLRQVELASSSFGQTHKVTPLQMITAYAAVVNGGNLVTPYLVEQVTSNDGEVLWNHETSIKRQVISEETSKTMASLMETVVQTNGGSNAYIKGYHIGGKSGTSQKQDVNLATGREDNYVSSFVGFAPADDPQVIMLVMVDEPRGTKYYGSAVAAPVVSNVFAEALPYLGIQPQYTAEELANMEVAVPMLEGRDVSNAQAEATASGLKPKVIGEGTTVIRQVPERGVMMDRDGTILLYTDDRDLQTVSVPNLSGLNVQQANQQLTNSGLNILLAGGAANNANSRASAQSIAPGEKVAKGTVIEVTFVINDETG